jgi:hypothetical protein
MIITKDRTKLSFAANARTVRYSKHNLNYYFADKILVNPLMQLG